MYIVFFSNCKFILALTLRQHHHSVLYDTILGLALILIDGAMAHLLKATYIYPLALSTCTLTDYFSDSCPLEDTAKGRKYNLNSSKPHYITPDAHGGREKGGRDKGRKVLIENICTGT